MKKKHTYQSMFEDVIRSGRYPGHMGKIKGIAQRLYANDRTREKEECACHALEFYESMTGYYFDPTKEQLEEITNGIF